ncbi:MAG TPA: HD domain-containing phosphohydrolase [Solirubrobacterales bacterium]|nr:HD domain-containing phosphohydrolase [Solirubrobacterales bacterium]
MRPSERDELEAERAGTWVTGRKRLLRSLTATLAELRPGVDAHCRRVAGRSALLAGQLGLAGDDMTRIRVAALLHDIGKIETPSEIVDKPGPLTRGEYAEMRHHAAAGAALVEALGDPDLTAIVRHHHERFDGRGYPDGLRGYAIPLGARILAVADTFDALVSPRPYRPPMSERRALVLLDTAAGTQLDPAVVRVALRLAARRHPPRPPARRAGPAGSADAAAPAPPPRPRRG